MYFESIHTRLATTPAASGVVPFRASYLKQIQNFSGSTLSVAFNDASAATGGNALVIAPGGTLEDVCLSLRTVGYSSDGTGVITLFGLV